MASQQQNLRRRFIFSVIMTAFLRKDFMYLLTRNSSYICKSKVPFSVSINHFFSTSTKNEPVIDPTVYDFLLHKHHFSPATATELASVIPHLKNPEKSDSLLSFLKKNDFSNSHLAKILKYNPYFISSDLEKSVKPKIKILQELGLSNNDIADLCARNATFFFHSVNNRVIPALSVLRGVLGSDANVVKLVMKSGRFLVKDLEKCMVPNIEFLKSRSVPMEQIIRTMYSYTRLMLLNPKNLRRCAEKAEELGARPSSGMYIHSVRAIASLSDELWELKLEAFRSLGFSEGDILNTFRKHPQLFTVSVKKMREVGEVLVSTGKYDVASIVTYPMCLACSVEKRCKPRLQVLAALEHKKLIKQWPSLSTLFVLTDMSFFTKFVAPYMDEVGHLFVLKGTILSERKAMLSPGT